MGAGLGSMFPVMGNMVGAGLGFVGGIAQQYAIDTVTDEGIHLASVGIQSQFPSLTPEEANMLAVATVITAGSTKVAKDYLQKHWKPFGAGASGIDNTSDVISKTTTTHLSEIKTPTSNSTKIKEVTGATKKFEIDAAIPESHVKDLVKYEAGVTLTAKDIFQQNPHITKHYLNEMAELTTVGAVHDKQLPLLKDILRKQEFVKLDQPSQLKHRGQFRNIKDRLIEEWSVQTAKEWPVYEQNYYKKNGDLKRKIGDPYDGHHIIPVSHGGPNEWWNMQPAHFLDEHLKIHGADSVFKELFNSKIKK